MRGLPGEGETVLILGAHPDDEAMCGGLIARLVDNGCHVHHYWFSSCAVSTVARGYDPEVLQQECERSRDILGIAQSCRGNFDFPVREFPAYRQAILDVLIGLRNAISPSLVLTAASTDIHQDHSTLTVEAIRAFKTATILGYELPWNQLTTEHQCFVTLNSSHLARKIAAVQAYRTQAASAYASTEL